MKIESYPMTGPLLFSPVKFSDNRGYFVETYRQSEFNAVKGNTVDFLQENRSLSIHRHTVRGLHCQVAPKAQGKLIQCIRGSILDVVVDIRPESPTYQQSLKIELSAENMQQLWIPPGFLHGFLTLEDNTEVQYKCTEYYAPEFARTVDWMDPDLGIDWGINPSQAILSEKDKNAQSFKGFELENLSTI